MTKKCAFECLRYFHSFGRFNVSLPSGEGPVFSFSSSPPTSEHQILLSGDDKGDLRVYSFSDGRLLQSAEKAHDKQAFRAPRIGGASVSVGLSSMCKLDKGVFTAGGDGAVKLFRFS